MIVREDNGLYTVKPEKIIDTDKFREAALRFRKEKCYTSAPKDTTAYIEYWREECKRCIEGYTALDGDFIPGYYYFYLNYCPILLVRERYKEDGRGHRRKYVERKREFPDFWDSDYDYFMAIEHAEMEGKHMSVLKAREKGYSFKGGSMLCRNFFLIRDSKSYAIASEMEFLTKDGLLSKAWEFMDFLNKHTGWAKKRQKINQSTHRRASYVKRDAKGNEVEGGYMSEIMGISLKNDADKARGKRGKLILWEECLGRGTKVLMSDFTLKKIESIKVGDTVLKPNGTQGTVAATRTGTAKMYNIEQKYGNTYTVSENHKLRLLWGRCDYTPKQIFLEKDNFYSISVKDYLNLPYYIKRESYGIKSNRIDIFDKENVSVAPYLFGYWLGDGDKTRPCVCTNDTEIIDYFTKELPKINNNFSCTIRDLSGTTAKVINFGEYYFYGKQNHNKTMSIFKEMGVYKNKHVPQEYKSSSCKVRLELLAGFIDADGYKCKNTTGSGYCYDIVHKTGTLIEDIKFIAESLGFRVSFGTKKILYKGEYRIYNRLRISGDVFDIPVKVERKKIKPFERVNRIRTTPIKVKGIGEDKYFGFTLETIGDNEWERSFLLSDFTITQNCGKFPNLTQSWQIAQPSVETSGVAFGLMIAFGTGGTDLANYEGLQELFMYPDGYNILAFKNIWDDQGGKCGYFVPEYVNMYGSDVHGHMLMDEFGNTDYLYATRHALVKRDEVLKGANDRNAIDRWIAEHPFTPTEACLQISGNIYPKEEMIRQLAYIRNSESIRNYKQVGDLDFDESGVLKWTQAIKPKDILKYRLGSNDNKRGQVVIWEHPVDNPPYGLYIAGCDPYDHDQAASSDSLGSVFVYKRFQSFESFHDILVAEYTGRPDTVNEFYENVRKLIIYYNAKLLYENEKPGLFAYFVNKHSEYLLADQPDILTSIIKDSSVRRRKGVHMAIGIKDYAELRVRDWLNEEYEPGKKNLTKIMSEPLLEELIAYNRDGNFDRAIAFMLVMLFREELHNNHVKEAKEEEKRNSIFREPLFNARDIPRFIDL